MTQETYSGSSIWAARTNAGLGKIKSMLKTEDRILPSKELGDRLMSSYLNSIQENRLTEGMPSTLAIIRSVVILTILVGVVISLIWMR